MAFDYEVKELAYKLDPECWVSYSGAPRSHKASMDQRRNLALREAQKQHDKLREREGHEDSGLDRLTQIAMEAFEPLSSVLRYRTPEKWHVCDVMAMRAAVEAVLEARRC